jgi:hypothetical protein
MGPLLVGVDGVVYYAGALQDRPGESLRVVHETGLAAPYRTALVRTPVSDASFVSPPGAMMLYFSKRTNAKVAIRSKLQS